MIAHAVTVEKLTGSYLVDFGPLNWQALFPVSRPELEARIRDEIEFLTGDKAFGVAMNFVA